MKLICINLERRQDRMKRFIERAKESGLQNEFDVQIFSAIDGKNISQHTPGIELMQPPVLGVKAAPNVPKGLFRTGVVGCALSHYNVWKQLVNDSEHEWYVVCEDDAVFCDKHGATQLKKRMQNIISKNENIGLVYFAGPPNKCERYMKMGEFYDGLKYSTPTMMFVKWNYSSIGTVCYAISKSAAEALVDIAENNGGLWNAIDWFMMENWEELRRLGLKVLACNPYLVYNVDTSDSNIQSETESVPLLVAKWNERPTSDNVNEKGSAVVSKLVQ